MKSICIQCNKRKNYVQQTWYFVTTFIWMSWSFVCKPLEFDVGKNLHRNWYVKDLNKQSWRWAKDNVLAPFWCLSPTLGWWCHVWLCSPRLLNVKHLIGETFGKLILQFRREWGVRSLLATIFSRFQMLVIWSQWWNWFGLNSIMIWGTKIA